MAETNDLAYYMALPYTYILLPDPDEGGYVIKVAELPGCISQGDTADEAATRIREAMEVWIEGQIEDGRAVPEPGEASSSGGYSGKFLVRVPKSVHRQLAEAAEREGVSLNLYVASALAAASGTGQVNPSAGRPLSAKRIGALGKLGDQPARAPRPSIG